MIPRSLWHEPIAQTVSSLDPNGCRSSAWLSYTASANQQFPMKFCLCTVHNQTFPSEHGGLPMHTKNHPYNGWLTSEETCSEETRIVCLFVNSTSTVNSSFFSQLTKRSSHNTWQEWSFISSTIPLAPSRAKTTQSPIWNMAITLTERRSRGRLSDTPNEYFHMDSRCGSCRIHDILHNQHASVFPPIYIPPPGRKSCKFYPDISSGKCRGQGREGVISYRH